ncbi:peptidase M23 [Clostridium tertium]|uniref:Uncharacterized protein n=1 Tax=Clostridium tertium TaxID=1559 RepID=A0A6N3D837_9CLOT
MVNYYRDAYSDYYKKMRGKVKDKDNKKEKIFSSRDDIYPNTSNVRNYSYKAGTYGAKQEKKKFKYIDRLIGRLIITFLLFLGVFTLKVLPNEEAKMIYSTIKTEVNRTYDYTKVLDKAESVGINYKWVLNIVEEKYNELKSDLKL